VTCAQKTLAFNTKVRVTNLRNGSSVICRVNDRGPFTPKRIIDLSLAGARAIGMIKGGVALVSVEVLQKDHEAYRRSDTLAPGASGDRPISLQ
jgi:rare lipoprotein A